MYDYEERNKDARFKVTRWCCVSGNCTKCCDRRFGQRVRVIQILTDDPGKAEKCFHNYREFGPKMFETHNSGVAQVK